MTAPALSHALHLAFMLGVAVPATTRHNRVMLTFVREVALERLLVMIARDVDAFEKAAAECDLTTT